MQIVLTPDLERFRAAFHSAFAAWSADPRVQVHALTPGRSGAFVFRVDLSGATGDIEPGQYILKLRYARSEPTSARDAGASSSLGIRSPRLVRSTVIEQDQGDRLWVGLFELAGGQAVAYASGDRNESQPMLMRARDLAREILLFWSDQEIKNTTAGEALVLWCGHGLGDELARSVEQASDPLWGTADLTTAGHQILVNPGWFLEWARSESALAIDCVWGTIHGDLHPGNILFHRFDPKEHPYWIIDLEYSRLAPLGFDHAYFECSAAILALAQEHPARLIRALAAVDRPGFRATLPERTLWLYSLIKEMRDGIHSWISEHHPKRAEEVARQFSLARVGAGLVWAAQADTSRERSIAAAYAGFGAARYLQRFEPDLWLSLDERAKGGGSLRKREPDSLSSSLSEQLWRKALGFSTTRARYILVAEGLDDRVETAAIGHLPWSLVIDLDPYSADKGLHRHASSIVATRRALHTFSKAEPDVDFRTATLWMMSAGWSLRGEAPNAYDDWRYAKLPKIRSLVRELRIRAGSLPIVAVILPGRTIDPDAMSRITKAVAAIDEVSRGDAITLVLGGRQLVEPLAYSHIPLGVNDFADALAAANGTTGPALEVNVPGPDRIARAVSQNLLRSLSENLEVLHSGVVESEEGRGEEGRSSSEFWRGGHISYSDLRDGLDVPRAVHSGLTRVVEERLEQHRTQTVVLSHNPGGGGSTAAMRVAWDLHWTWPTVILGRASEALADKLQSLFNVAERPVLLVAESSDLKESEREDLYRELSRRNVRVVLLYVRRSLSTPLSGDATVPAELDDEEALAFYGAYSSLTEDKRRTAELKRITSDPTLSRYRSPFFFGLITFEREFLKVDEYVGAHLEGISWKQREALVYLSLCTIYSNSGPQLELLKQLLGVAPVAELGLGDLLGSAAPLATVRGGVVRIMHQVLAEQCLQRLYGEGDTDWRSHLRDLSIDFIRDVCTFAVPESEPVRALLRQLFVDRQGVSGEGPEDRGDFAPIIEELDQIRPEQGQAVLAQLTQGCPWEPHFWNHLGRHQMYRLNRDLDKAEEHLEHAIQLNPADSIHHHTLGLVRRGRMRDALSAVRDRRAGEVLEVLDRFFDGAAKCFQATRERKPDSMYGYVTHVQMIVDAAKALLRASGAASVAHVDPACLSWIEEQLSSANSLIDSAKLLYTSLDRNDTYLDECLEGIEKLYGNKDAAVRIWEIANEGRRQTPASRRALAQIYVFRRDNRWRDLGRAELTRIIELTEENLRSASRREEDFRLWFEAYRLVPEFDIDSAISNLALWAGDFRSWRAAFYMYVLQFVLWFDGRTDSTEEFEEGLKLLEGKTAGRRTHSPLWLSVWPRWCPLASHYDLGEWDRKANFWKNYGVLRRINGVIDENISGPQAGRILIDGRAKAFFVPGRQFSKNQDENQPVNFTLGFSPAGLRAWDVRRGHVQDGDRKTALDRGELPTHMAPVLVQEEALEARLRELQIEQIMEFIAGVVTARGLAGGEMLVRELEQRVDAAFGLDGATRALGSDDLGKLLKDSGYGLSQRGDEWAIALSGAPSGSSTDRTAFGEVVHREGSWGFIRDADHKKYWFSEEYAVPSDDQWSIVRGDLVEFSPDQNSSGPVAQRIRRLPEYATLRKGEYLPREELPAAVEETIRAAADDSRSSGRKLLLAELRQEIAALFRGRESLEERLGVSSLSKFVNSLDGLSVAGRSPDHWVRPERAHAFGRLPTLPPGPAKPGRSTRTTPHEASGLGPETLRITLEQSSKSKEELRRDSADLAIHLVKKAGDGGLSLVSLGNRLRKVIPGEGPLGPRLGVKNLSAFVESIPELELRVQGGESVAFLIRVAGREGGGPP